jgi:predicted double-glycine peptidase
MALHPHALENRVLETEATRSAKYRRWWWLSLVVAIVLGVYAGTLAWVTKRVEAGVERSIQPLPVVMQDRQHDAG